jgi:DNA mismatch repair protein MutL
MPIFILDSHVIDQIAAGEVIERPSQLVKELVENSLDAGATEIEVRVDKSGRNFEVRDDGHGLGERDLPLALARHATSKIARLEDLWSIGSFGFRGEALASAAAVADLTLISRERNAEQAWQVRSRHGQVDPVQATSHGSGTTVLVRSLFANVPARLKFLKTDATEVQHIRQVLKAMAIARPEVAFRVIVDEELWRSWPRANSRVERAEQVLEVRPLFDGVGQVDEVSVEVALASPAQTQNNSRQLWFFVQNRYVTDTMMRASVLDAYRQLLMHGEYPVAAVWVTLPADQVDVNVHPAKAQVKFADSSKVYRAIHNVCRRVLESGPWVRNQAPVPAQSHEPGASGSGAARSLGFAAEDFDRFQVKSKNNSFGVEPAPVQAPVHVYELLRAPASAVQKSFWSHLAVLGQLHQTYILAQDADNFYLIDQHAAHERVLFESLMSGHREGRLEKQTYLIPLPVAARREVLDRWHELGFSDWGLEIERVGPEMLQVIAAPAIVSEDGLVKALTKAFADFEERGYSVQGDKAIGDIFASMACHSAIRAGQTLAPEQMASLLRQMDEFPLSGFCPHGRPVHIQMSLAQIERDFGRRV